MRIVFVSLLLLASLIGSSQIIDSPIYTADSKIPSYLKIEEENSIKLDKNSNQDHAFLERILHLNMYTKAVLIDTLTDRAGGFHKSYREYYKDIKVEGTKCIIHYSKEGISTMVNGNFKTIDLPDVIPNIKKEEALYYAFQFIGIKCNMDKNSNKITIIENKDTLCIDSPQNELVIYCKNNVAFLAYKCYMPYTGRDKPQFVFIDAHNGTVLGKRSSVRNISTVVETLYSHNQSIETQYNNNQYRLRDYTRGNGIETYTYINYNYLTNQYIGADVISVNNSWNDIANMYKAALDVHWGVEKTYDFYYNIFNRNSYDNYGSKLISYVNVPDNNAFWDDECKCMIFGNNYPNTQYVALDIVAHEFTHAVTDNIAGFNYQGESGALSEGMSDAFAVCVENMVKPLKGDSIWMIGEDIVTGGNRDLRNPTCKYYHGSGWIDTSSTTDAGGVHTNSGVFNYWFYLLVHGGYGSNECSDNYLVEGIGLDNAIQICYLMNIYLTSDATFSDAMQCSLLAAQALNYNDHVICQIYKAWFDVGVNNPGILMLAPSSICTTSHFFISNLPSYFTVNWDIDNSVLSILSGQGTNHLRVQKVGNGWADVTATIRYGTEVVKQFCASDIIVGCPNLGRVDVYNEDLGYINFSYSGNRLVVDEVTDSIYDRYEMYLYKSSGNSWVQVGYYSQIYNNGIISYFGPSGYYKIKIRGYNDCGYSDWLETYIESISNRSDRDRLYNLEYNSESQNLTIRLLSEESNYEVQLWNSRSLIRREKTNLTEYSISLHGMDSGIYIVRIIIDGVVYTEKILKGLK